MEMIDPTEKDAILSPSPDAGQYSQRYRGYILVILTLVFVVNFLDRQILSILLPQIKREFHLSDWQIGLLTGPAFGIVYAVMGIPIGLLADRTSRRMVIAGSVFVFSAMTALCGLVGQFWQLCAGRFGVGIGEAGSTPPVSALLSDLYPPDERNSALSFYFTGTNIGLLIGLFAGGMIAERFGWRHALWAASGPGLVLALLIVLTVREPSRGLAEKIDAGSEQWGAWQVLRHLWRQPAFRWLALSNVASNAMLASMLAFVPILLTQSHGLSTAQVGLALAILTGLFGGVGTFFSGIVADRFGRNGPERSMFAPMIASLVAAPFLPVYFLADNTMIALIAGIVPSTLAVVWVAPSYALSQSLVPLEMRSQASAMLTAFTGLFGLCFGPPLVGVVSDSLHPHFGTESLQYALSLTTLMSVLAGYSFWRVHGALHAQRAERPVKLRARSSRAS